MIWCGLNPAYGPAYFLLSIDRADIVVATHILCLISSEQHLYPISQWILPTNTSSGWMRLMAWCVGAL